MVLAIFHLVWRLCSYWPGLDNRLDLYRIAGLTIIIIAICLLDFKSIFEFSSVLKSKSKRTPTVYVCQTPTAAAVYTSWPFPLQKSTFLFHLFNRIFGYGRIPGYCLNGKFQISLNEFAATTTVNGFGFVYIPLKIGCMYVIYVWRCHSSCINSNDNNK